MTLPGFEQLFARADQRSAPAGIAVAGGADPTVIEALAALTARGWVQPLLCGPRNEIERLADQLAVDVRQFAICDEGSPARDAVAAIHRGEAQLLMKGQVATPDLMSAVLDKQTGLRTGRAIGQVVLMELPRDDRRLLLVDTGIAIAPTLDQKRQLLTQAAELARQLGVAEPRVALMAATEKENPAMAETLDAAPLMQAAAEGAFGPCHVAGPLSFDLAYAAVAGDRKGLAGEVTGRADILLFPNLLSANLTVKAIMYTADCRFGGLLCGTLAPVVFMSRADDAITRQRSIAFALAAYEMTKR